MPRRPDCSSLFDIVFIQLAFALKIFLYAFVRRIVLICSCNHTSSVFCEKPFFYPLISFLGLDAIGIVKPEHLLDLMYASCTYMTDQPLPK